MSLPDRLALDTNCFIYLWEEAGSARSEFLERSVFRAAAGGKLTLFTSTLAVAELLVTPYRLGLPDRARLLRDAVTQLPGMTVVDIDVQLATGAARLRGQFGIALADAFHIATAERFADALLTNDRRLARPEDGVRVLVLDDLAS